MAEVRNALAGRYVVVRSAYPLRPEWRGSPDPDHYVWSEDDYFCVGFPRKDIVRPASDTQPDTEIAFFANPGGRRTVNVRQIIRATRTPTRG